MFLPAHSAIVLLLISSRSPAQGALFTTQQTDDVIHFVESLRQCRGIVGLTMAVTKGNETWTRGFGMADRERGRNVSTSDLFGIGSLTKAFTSALISLFINDTERYSWNTRIVDILGKDFMFATDELTHQATLKDILTHRTGLANSQIHLLAGSKLTAAQFARRIRYLPVKNLFRDVFDYNNAMYGLAGYVTEVMAGGVPWEEALHQRLLEPLNMTATGVLGRTLSLTDDRLARPYVTLGGQAVLHHPAAYNITTNEPAGAIASSADDMAKWLLLLTNEGRRTYVHETQLLDASHLEEMTAPHTAIPATIRARFNLLKPPFPVLYLTDSYGLGWITANYRGYRMIWHSGGLFAYVSYIALIPQLKLGFFVSTNGPNGANASSIIYQLFFYVADTIMGQEPWLNSTNACLYPHLWKGKPSGGKPPRAPVYDVCDFEDVDRYLGRYEHQLFGDVDVVRNGSNGLYVHYGHLEGRLCKTEERNVAVFEVLGIMAFWYRPGSRPSYLQLNFTHPYHNGTYQEVVLSKRSSREMMLVFQRDASNAAASHCCSGGRANGFRNIVVSLWVVTVLSCYIM